MASIDTCVTPNSTSQSRIAVNSSTKVRNVRTVPMRPPPGPGVRTAAVTDFLCTSSPAARHDHFHLVPPPMGSEGAVPGVQTISNLTRVLVATIRGSSQIPDSCSVTGCRALETTEFKGRHHPHSHPRGGGERRHQMLSPVSSGTTARVTASPALARSAQACSTVARVSGLVMCWNCR